MTKELELFKRWFGWDPSEFEQFHAVCVNDGQMSVDLEFWSLPKIGLITYIINRPYFCSIYPLRGFVGVNYRIPRQYHSEWEQYVKEKENDHRNQHLGF